MGRLALLYQFALAGLALLLRLFGLRGLSGGFLRLSTAVGTLLLRLVMGMGLFVILAALAAEEEQNLLRVPTHARSLRHWLLIGKRTTMERYA